MFVEYDGYGGCYLYMGPKYSHFLPGTMKRRYSQTQSTTPKFKQAKYQKKKAPVPSHVASDYALIRNPRPETKILDVASGSTNITTTGTVFNLLSGIAVGTAADGNFIGKQIFPISLDIRWEIIGAQSNLMAGADLSNKTRLLVFQWQDASTPNVTGVLKTADPLSPISFVNYDNIQVLRDRIYSTWVQSYDSGSSYANSNAITKRWYIKGKHMTQISYNAGAGSWQKGQLYLVAISDSSVAPNPVFKLYSRLVFTDV